MSLIKPDALIQKHFGYVTQSYDCAFWSPKAMLRQHQEWRPLAWSNFLSMRIEFIRFLRRDSEHHVQSDRRSVNHGPWVLDLPRGHDF